MSERDDIMRELVKSAATIYADMGIEYPLPFVFRRVEIPALRGKKRVRAVFILEDDEPLSEPLPLKEYQEEIEQVLVVTP